MDIRLHRRLRLILEWAKGAASLTLVETRAVTGTCGSMACKRSLKMY
jgi:hypothetical protein